MEVMKILTVGLLATMISACSEEQPSHQETVLPDDFDGNLVLAQRGVAEAQYNVGVLLLTGHGVEVDERRAAEWFTKAALQGDREACFNLGALYAEGRGVPKDLKIAANFYREAADQGFSPAKERLKELFGSSR